MPKSAFCAIFLAVAYLLVSCTGPTSWINCKNQTLHNASLYLTDGSGDNTVVIASLPDREGSDFFKDRGQFSWKVRLFTNSGAQLFSDSGAVEIEFGNNTCTIRYYDPDSINVSWAWEE